MRRRLAITAACVGAVGAVAPFRLAGSEDVVDYWPVYAFLLLLVALLPIGLAFAYGHGGVSQRWAVLAVVVFAVVGFLTGWGGFYLGYASALLLGLAIAAGEPLPPPDPYDDRLTRPMPRRHD